MAVPNGSAEGAESPQDLQPARAANPVVDALVEAARYGDIDEVRELLAQGLHFNSQDTQGRTALHMAAANGHMDVVQYLISHGADVNIENDEKNTPLHWAALNGEIEVRADSTG